MAVIVNPNDPNNPNNTQQNGSSGSPSGQPLQTVGTASPSGQPPAGSPTAAIQANNLAQRQGSGRFTNLSKYIQANQGAGARIAGQIGQNINQGLEKEQNKAQDYYSKLGQSVAQANQTTQQGQGFQQQLKDIGTQIGGAQTAGFEARPQQSLDQIQQFTQNPNFQQFQDIQAGRGINENLLNLQQQKALEQAGQTAGQAQQAKEQLGTEAGRFQLLQNQFGGANRPGYTVGQQRLDQALLGGNLGGVQSDVSGRLRAAQGLAKQAGAQGQEVNRLTQAEKDLMSGINTQAGSNEQSYLDLLKSYIPGVNEQRAAEVADLQAGISSFNNPYQNAGEGQRQTGFTTDQTSRLGLGGANTGVYNVFKGSQGVGGVNDINQIAQIGAEARNAQDIANQEDLNRYKALQSIIGKDAADRLTGGTNQIGEDVIGKSYAAKTGEEGLKERLAAAQNQFEQTSKTPITYKYQPNEVSASIGTPEEMIARGRGAVGYKYDPKYNPKNETVYLTPAQQASGNYGNQSYYQAIVDRFKNFINQQNYNQTLGGQRQTFLDAEAAAAQAKKGITPKIPGAPITGTDPALDYLNNIVGKMPIKGS